jgi:hypothetical protein
LSNQINSAPRSSLTLNGATAEPHIIHQEFSLPNNEEEEEGDSKKKLGYYQEEAMKEINGLNRFIRKYKVFN